MNRFGNRAKPRMWLAALLLTGLAAGCGGGGGDDGAGASTAAATANVAAAVAAAGRTLTVGVGAGTGAGGLGLGPAPVVLGLAGNYAILAEALITTTGVTAVTGDLGMSPQAATFVQGFSLVLDGTGCFATTVPTSLVTGKVFAADFNTGGCTTPAILTTAITNKRTALTDANGRAADYTELGAGNIGGLTLPPAVYKWTTGVLIPTDLFLVGGPNDVWIFQVAQGITLANAARVRLLGGALPKNIFWATGGIAAFGTTSHMEGIVLSASKITLATGATANGRLLAQTDVTLDAVTLVQPAP